MPKKLLFLFSTFFLLSIIIALLIYKIIPSRDFVPKVTQGLSEATISVCVPESLWGTSSDPELLDEVDRTIRDKTYTRINRIVFPDAVYEEKLNEMINSNNVPDVFYASDMKSKIKELLQKSLISPIEKYIAGISEFDAVNSQILERYKVNDSLYALPLYRPASKVLYFNKNVADRYGMVIRNSMSKEELYNELKKAVRPDGYVIGISKWVDDLQFIYNAFSAYPGIYKKNGKYIDGFTEESMDSALKYAAKLVSENIIDKNFIFYEKDMLKDKIAEEKIFGCIDYDYKYLSYAYETEKKQNKQVEYLCTIDLSSGSSNGSKSLCTEESDEVFFISSNCKDKIQAAKLLVWLNYSKEGQLLRKLGVEGKHFFVYGKKIEFSKRAKRNVENINPDFLARSFADLTDTLEFNNIISSSMDKQKKILEETSKNYNFIDIPKAGESETFDKLNKDLTKKKDEIIMLILLGKISVEEGKNQYKEYFKKVNGEVMLHELNR